MSCNWISWSNLCHIWCIKSSLAISHPHYVLEIHFNVLVLFQGYWVNFFFQLVQANLANTNTKEQSFQLIFLLLGNGWLVGHDRRSSFLINTQLNKSSRHEAFYTLVFLYANKKLKKVIWYCPVEHYAKNRRRWLFKKSFFSSIIIIIITYACDVRDGIGMTRKWEKV